MPAVASPSPRPSSAGKGLSEIDCLQAGDYQGSDPRCSSCLFDSGVRSKPSLVVVAGRAVRCLAAGMERRFGSKEVSVLWARLHRRSRFPKIPACEADRVLAVCHRLRWAKRPPASSR